VLVAIYLDLYALLNADLNTDALGRRANVRDILFVGLPCVLGRNGKEYYSAPVFSIPFNISVSSFHLEFMLHSWRDAENEEMKNSRKKKSVHRSFFRPPILKAGLWL
jgi:hypothetical protein